MSFVDQVGTDRDTLEITLRVLALDYKNTLSETEGETLTTKNYDDYPRRCICVTFHPPALSS